MTMHDKSQFKSHNLPFHVQITTVEDVQSLKFKLHNAFQQAQNNSQWQKR